MDVKAALYHLNKTMVISQIYKTDMTVAVALNAFIGRLRCKTTYVHMLNCSTISHIEISSNFVAALIAMLSFIHRDGIFIKDL